MIECFRMIFALLEKGEKMSDYKEIAAVNIPKEYLANLKADIGFGEHVVKHISSELAERIMDILEREEEIIVKQSDLRVSEFIPTESVEYRRQINWSPLVRCKDCIHKPTGSGANHDITFPKQDYKCPCRCDDDWYSWMPDDDWFCANGERREDADSY